MNKEKALSLAAAICSKKEHCSWEIQEKLVKWKIPEKEIKILEYPARKWAKQKIIKQHQVGLCFFVKVVYNKIAVRVRPYGPCTSGSFYGKCFQEP